MSIFENANKQPVRKNPLCSAIMQVAHDIRTLLELSVHESGSTWDSFIEEAKRELEEEHFTSDRATDELGVVALDGFSFTTPRRYDPRFFTYDIIQQHRQQRSGRCLCQAVLQRGDIG